MSLASLAYPGLIKIAGPTANDQARLSEIAEALKTQYPALDVQLANDQILVNGQVVDTAGSGADAETVLAIVAEQTGGGDDAGVAGGDPNETVVVDTGKGGDVATTRENAQQQDTQKETAGADAPWYQGAADWVGEHPGLTAGLGLGAGALGANTLLGGKTSLMGGLGTLGLLAGGGYLWDKLGGWDNIKQLFSGGIGRGMAAKDNWDNLGPEGQAALRKHFPDVAPGEGIMGTVGKTRDFLDLSEENQRRLGDPNLGQFAQDVIHYKGEQPNPYPSDPNSGELVPHPDDPSVNELGLPMKDFQEGGSHYGGDLPEYDPAMSGENIDFLMSGMENVQRISKDPKMRPHLEKRLVQLHKLSPDMFGGQTPDDVIGALDLMEGGLEGMGGLGELGQHATTDNLNKVQWALRNKDLLNNLLGAKTPLDMDIAGLQLGAQTGLGGLTPAWPKALKNAPEGSTLNLESKVPHVFTPPTNDRDGNTVTKFQLPETKFPSGGSVSGDITMTEEARTGDQYEATDIYNSAVEAGEDPIDVLSSQYGEPDTGGLGTLAAEEQGGVPPLPTTNSDFKNSGPQVGMPAVNMDEAPFGLDEFGNPLDELGNPLT